MSNQVGRVVPYFVGYKTSLSMCGSMISNFKDKYQSTLGENYNPMLAHSYGIWAF